MSKETLEDLKAIVDNAPDGAEYVSICGSGYAKFENNVFLQWIHGKWVGMVTGNIYSRSLSDIERIIELMKRGEV